MTVNLEKLMLKVDSTFWSSMKITRRRLSLNIARLL